MDGKKVVRNLLLVFVGGSVVYMVAAEIADRRYAATGGAVETGRPGLITPSTKLIVYYFSEGKECYTCEQIPVFAREALERHFAAELASGAIVWATIDVDEPRNEHYATTYNLYAKSIVIVRVVRGEPGPWRNLDRVWDLVYDKAGFIEYVRSSIRDELDAAS